MLLAYYSATALNASGAPAGTSLMIELTFKNGLQAIKAAVKTPQGAQYAGLALAALKSLLATA
jgi:hypothetical protein